jgi:hypothetical protein
MRVVGPTEKNIHDSFSRIFVSWQHIMFRADRRHELPHEKGNNGVFMESDL